MDKWESGISQIHSRINPLTTRGRSFQRLDSTQRLLKDNDDDSEDDSSETENDSDYEPGGNYAKIEPKRKNTTRFDFGHGISLPSEKSNYLTPSALNYGFDDDDDRAHFSTILGFRDENNSESENSQDEDETTVKSQFIDIKDEKDADEKPKKPPKKASWDVFSESESDKGISHSDAHTWKIINMVMRFIASIFFFLIVLVTGVTSKISLLVMTFNIRPTKKNFTVNVSGHVYVVKNMQNGHMDLQWVWALMLVILTPYVFTALDALWKIIFKKTRSLKGIPLLTVLVIETLHSVGLCLLVFYILPSFDPLIGSFMLLNVAFFPGLIKIFQSKPKSPEESNVQSLNSSNSSGIRAKFCRCVEVMFKKILALIMVLLQLGCMAVWMSRAYVKLDSVALTALIPVSMIFTSISWWENYVSGKREKKYASKQPSGETSTQPSGETTTLNGGPQTPPKAKKHKVTPTNCFTAIKRRIKKRRTKIIFLTSLWKIILTIAFPALAFGYKNGNNDCFSDFFVFHDVQTTPTPPRTFRPTTSNSSINTTYTTNTSVTSVTFDDTTSPLTSTIRTTTMLPQHVLGGDCSLFGSLTYTDDIPLNCNDFYPFLMAAVNIGCSIICYKFAKSACKVLLQIPCFVVPLILTTPVSIGLIIGSYADPSFFQTLLGCTIDWVDLKIYWVGPYYNFGHFLLDFCTDYWVPVGLAAYVSLLFITGHVWKPGVERMARTDKIFSKSLYCGVLLDQSILLNRRQDEDDPLENRTEGKWMEAEEVQDLGKFNLEEARSRLRKDTTPFIYICATMWHESESEMIMMLKSVFRLDADQSARKNAELFFNVTDPDYYEFEAHIFFDDAYQSHLETEHDYTVNDFVKQLVRVVDTAASAVHNTEMVIPKPTKIPTPYGGRLRWKLPGGNYLIAHLKDKAKIRHRKRWSQVMYMYYFLGYKLISSPDLSLESKRVRANHTFLLALDGDVDFQPEAVQILVDRMRQNAQLGAACGRIHPIGSGPMVWYQKFEYAISHWLQKSTEHVLGCVLCSPGCFSLFRGSALMDDNVMKRYTTPPTEARHYVQYDQGEDRWLCTLLLQQGYRVEYCAASDSFTFAPEGFYEFYNQRRRWTPSTMANIIDLLGDWKSTTEKNQDISFLYVLYQLMLLVSGFITPGTIFLLIVGSISTSTNGDIPLYASIIINVIPIAIFVLLLFKADAKTQLGYAAILSLVYTVIMMLVLVGMIKLAADSGICSISTIFLVGVASIFVITALLHPMEFPALLHGFLYFLSIPSMSMLLLLYSLGNLHVVSWGTRENPWRRKWAKQTDPPLVNLPYIIKPSVSHVKSAAPPPQQQHQKEKPEPKQKPNILRDTIARLADTHNATSDYAFSFGNLCRCFCCPKETNPQDIKFNAIIQSLNDLDSKVTELTMASVGGDSLRDISELPGDTTLASRHENFSAAADFFVGAGEQKVNPVFEVEKRDELKNPMWSEDRDLGEGKKEFDTEEEATFWKDFIQQYLYPIESDAEHEKKVKAELLELRNNVCLAFILTNTLFVVLISTLQIIAEETANLSIKMPCDASAFEPEEIEPISVTFTFVFGILLTLQFIAMLFHRFSTMLHIISITKIEFKRLTRKTTEEEPTVQETIDLVREMQSLRPHTPDEGTESNFGDDTDIDTPAGTLTRNSKKSTMWNRITTRGRQPVREQTLGRAFMKNFEKLANQMRSDNTDEVTPDKVEEDTKSKFKHFQRKSLKTIVKMVNDATYKEQVMKRSQVRKRWKRGAGKAVGGKARLLNVIEEARDQHRQEEERQQALRNPAQGTRLKSVVQQVVNKSKEEQLMSQANGASSTTTLVDVEAGPSVSPMPTIGLEVELIPGHGGVRSTLNQTQLCRANDNGLLQVPVVMDDDIAPLGMSSPRNLSPDIPRKPGVWNPSFAKTIPISQKNHSPSTDQKDRNADQKDSSETDPNNLNQSHMDSSRATPQRMGHDLSDNPSSDQRIMNGSPSDDRRSVDSRHSDNPSDDQRSKDRRQSDSSSDDQSDSSPNVSPTAGQSKTGLSARNTTADPVDIYPPEPSVKGGHDNEEFPLDRSRTTSRNSDSTTEQNNDRNSPFSYDILQNSGRNSAMSVDGTRISGRNSPVSVDGRQMSGRNGPVSVDGRQMSGRNSPVSVDDTQMSGRNSPVSVDGTQRSGRNSPVSVDGTQRSGRNSPVSVDGTQRSGRNSPVSVDGTQRSGRNSPVSVDGTQRSGRNSPVSVDGTQRSGRNSPVSVDGKMNGRNSPVSVDGTRMSGRNSPVMPDIALNIDESSLDLLY